MIDLNRIDKLTPEVERAIEHQFTYSAWDEGQVTAGTRVRAALAEAVKVIIANVPPCPDRSTATRKIRESRMDCNSAITFRGV